MKHTQTKGVQPRLPTPQKGLGKTQRKSQSGYLKRPELGLMDRLLRSIHQVAHEDWIPSQYLTLIKHGRKAAKNLH
jgi:hypothetical protein